jgi:hypothetical protein
MTAIIPDKDLQLALNAELADAFPAMPIAWENVEYKPTVGTAYFRVWMLPAETEVVTLGQSPWQLRLGVFQVSVFYPIGVGFVVPKVKAAEVVAAFKANTSFVFNGLTVIIDKSWPAPGFADGVWYHIPVSVRYRCYYAD